MKDLEIKLENKVGELARMGKILGDHNISLEGGGTFNQGKYSIAHFLIKDANNAKFVLENEGFEILAVQEVLILKLRQDVSGQLGAFCLKLAEANVNILQQYSDHYNQLVLVVDKPEQGKLIADQWMETWWGNNDYCI